MNELEYVLARFDEHFAGYRGKRIFLHGSGMYRDAVLAKYGSTYRFAEKEDAEVIIFTERGREEADAFAECADDPVILMNMYGVDERQVRRDYEAEGFRTAGRWRRIIGAYDMIVFEAMDTFLTQNGGRITGVRTDARRIHETAVSLGKEVYFSLRKSFDSEAQKAALQEYGITGHIIERTGEDLSFRRTAEDNPGKRILYLGNGFLNEYLLPRCYGIDTMRIAGPVSGICVPFEDVLEEIREHDVISFDVFDTLLVRTTIVPDAVFGILAEDPAVRKYIPEGFREIRIRAEHEEKHRKLKDIYHVIAGGRGPAAAEEMRQAEMKTEKDMIRARTPLVRLLEYALSAGREVVLTSDMYMDAAEIGEILQEKGIAGYTRIFVSCEYRAFKQDGLFRNVRDAYPDKRILHIGDHPQADVMAAQDAGLDAVYIPSVLSMAQRAGISPDDAESRQVIMERFLDPFGNGQV